MILKDVKWIVVAEDDEYGIEIARHVLPAKLAPNFQTKEECSAFVDLINQHGGCIVADNKDEDVSWTYFGHTLSKDCDCKPRKSDNSLDPLYVHRENA